MVVVDRREVFKNACQAVGHLSVESIVMLAYIASESTCGGAVPAWKVIRLRTTASRYSAVYPVIHRLSNLCSAGYIRRVGGRRGRWAAYTLTDKGWAALDVVQGALCQLGGGAEGGGKRRMG